MDHENKMLAFANSNFHIPSLKGVSSIREIDKTYFSSSFGLLLYSQKPFLPIFNDLILVLMSGGIFNHWTEMFYEYKSKFKLARSSNKQVLTMDFMINWLLICSVPLIMSLIAFCIEIKLKTLETRKDEITIVQKWLD